MQTRFLFVRHGETKSNQVGTLDGNADTKLTPRGVKQAETLAQCLKHEPISAIFASPLSRSLETAKIIQKALPHKPEIIIHEEFKEIDCGDCTLRTIAEVKQMHPAIVEGWQTLVDPRFPNGENLADVMERSLPKLHHILQQFKGKTILLSGHGSLNVGIIGDFLKIPFGLRFKIRQNNCCINEIILEENDFTIIRVNAPSS